MRMPQERWKLRRENDALAARYLVVVELHRVDGAAAVGIILCVRAEDGGEQDTGLGSFGMLLNHVREKRIKRCLTL